MSKKQTLISCVAAAIILAGAIMPKAFAAQSVTVNVTPADGGSYTISGLKNGKANNKDKIGLEIKANTGYKCVSVTSKQISDLTCDNANFTMINKAVEITINFEKNTTDPDPVDPDPVDPDPVDPDPNGNNGTHKATAIASPAEGGSVEIIGEQQNASQQNKGYKPGTEMSLDIKANDGYKCVSVVSAQVPGLTCDNTAFKMPSEDVEITVNFELDNEDPEEPGEDPNGKGGTEDPEDPEDPEDDPAVAPDTGISSSAILPIIAAALIAGGAFVAFKEREA